MCAWACVCVCVQTQGYVYMDECTLYACMFAFVCACMHNLCSEMLINCSVGLCLC